MKIDNRKTVLLYFVILFVVIFVGFQAKAQWNWFQIENARMNQERAQLIYNQNN
jgi:hypothetical protein